jgi:hypothetical protein
MRSEARSARLNWSMTPHAPLFRERLSVHAIWFMAAAWLVILAKCVWVWWAVGHWHLPVHPLWIVAPTLVCAALATALWLAHERR